MRPFDFLLIDTHRKIGLRWRDYPKDPLIARPVGPFGASGGLLKTGRRRLDEAMFGGVTPCGGDAGKGAVRVGRFLIWV